MASTLENALKLLGLDNADDPALLWQNYMDRLGVLQTELIQATTETRQQDLQAQLAKLVAAYQLLRSSAQLRRQNGQTTSGLTPTPRSMGTPNPKPIVRPDGVMLTPVRVEAEPLAPGIPPSVIRPGVLLQGRYEVQSILGDGGMGRVYAARDRLKDEDVAIKVLRNELLSSIAARGRFLSEAKVSCRLAHPNIVRVYDVGVADGRYFFTMERLNGKSLRQRMQAQRLLNLPFPLEEATRIAHQLLDALRHAHRYIVHRDLKPENVWLEENGVVKLMDFGISRAYVQQTEMGRNIAVGTAYYMAPEQVSNSRDVDWRADQYAFGVLMYEMLTGKIPMGVIPPLERMRKDIPKSYARAIMRTLAPRPESRFQSLRELQNILVSRKSEDVADAAFSALGRSIFLGTIAGIVFAVLDGLSIGTFNDLTFPSGIAAGIGTAFILEFCEVIFRSRFKTHIVAGLTAGILWIATVLILAQRLSDFSDGLVMMLCGSVGASAAEYVTRRWSIAAGRYRLHAALGGAFFGSMLGLILLLQSDAGMPRNYFLSSLSGFLPGMIISVAFLRRRLWSGGGKQKIPTASGSSFTGGNWQDYLP